MRRRVGAVLLAVLLAGCGSSHPGMYPSTTPSTSAAAGRLNPAVTQATIHTTICVPGWTATIRPPASYTNTLKRQQLPPGADPSKYEEDHIVPLELGGAPRAAENLRPVPWPRASADDKVETQLHHDVCVGIMPLADAQAQILAVKTGE